MIKRKFYVISFIIVMVFMYGCSSRTLNVSDLEPSNIIINKDDITAKIKEDIIMSSKEDITLILENKTDYEYSYGVDFSLEVELDNKWYKVPFDKNSAFIEIGVVLKGNSESKEVLELSKYFSDLPDGKYRIVKTFYHDGKETFVEAPFEVRK